jgi:predicted phage tail protein
MANLNISWSAPVRYAYSVMASAIPGVVWQLPQTDWEIKGYRVQYRLERDKNWIEAGTTREPFIEIKGVTVGVYRVRIATIDVAGRSSSWVASGEFGTIINFVARFSEPNHAIYLGIV